MDKPSKNRHTFPTTYPTIIRQKLPIDETDNLTLAILQWKLCGKFIFSTDNLSGTCQECTMEPTDDVSIA